MPFHAFLGLCRAFAPSMEAAMACKLYLYLHLLLSRGKFIDNGQCAVDAGDAGHCCIPFWSMRLWGCLARQSRTAFVYLRDLIHKSPLA